MLFNSLEYFLFLPAVWLVHHFIGQPFRWLFLLAVSLIFYVSLKVPYLLGVITLVTIVTYWFGLWIYNAPPKLKRLLLWTGISTNVLILVIMKYLPFLADNLKIFLSFFDSASKVPHVQVFVAIGVSYYIFQAISYLSDIYLEIEEPEAHFGYFALYLAFFPKLLQGPIERANDLLPQLKQKYEFNYDNMRAGLLLFSFGLFKKVVLADRLGLYVDAAYDDVDTYQGLQLLLATYAYAFQIYFDFSGYTDMALGTARLFNINLTNNFNKPYLATSVADFWRRWHISFSRWILDYIFKPLQMAWRSWRGIGTAIALLATFFVSGLWHGASWGFVIWGLLHGFYMSCSLFYRPYQKKIHKILRLNDTIILKICQLFITFNFVCFAWIFFRADDPFLVINSIASHFNIVGITNLLMSNGIAEAFLLIVSIFSYVVFLKVYKYVSEKKYIFSIELSRLIYYSLLLISIIILNTQTEAKYIYFKF